MDNLEPDELDDSLAGLVPDEQAPERIALFENARTWLRTAYAGRGAGRSLSPIFSTATLTRLFKSEADYPARQFSGAIRERLIWLFEGSGRAGAYQAIENLMGHTEIGRSLIYRDYAGEYALFRFAAIHAPGSGGPGGNLQPGAADDDKSKTSNHPHLEFVEEWLRIYKDDDDEPAYEYKTHEFANDAIMVNGGVFYAGGKLFMPGLSMDNMSLAIVSASRAMRASSGMQGFWNSVGKRGSGTPFSARFFMVDLQNQSLIDRLRGPSKEAEFHKATGADYAYYMSL
jgi:hypothetical protein